MNDRYLVRIQSNLLEISPEPTFHPDPAWVCKWVCKCVTSLICLKQVLTVIVCRYVLEIKSCRIS